MIHLSEVIQQQGRMQSLKMREVAFCHGPITKMQVCAALPVAIPLSDVKQ
jgi:hypothetical protein